MAFNDTVLQDVKGLPAGSVIEASPYNVSAFDVFEDGLVAGRFVKFDTGSIDMLDASATPTIAGVAKRKISGEIGDGIYSTSGPEIDQVAEVCNFGFVTVEVTDSAEPTKLAPVYAINADTADAGKATEVATDNLEVADAVFWEEKAPGIWLVLLTKYLA